MKDVALWSMWYGILVTGPPVITRLLIKHTMARAMAQRRLARSIHRRSEVRHGIF